MLETVGAKSGQPRLRAQPEATVQFDDGRRVQVRAETLEGTDLAAAWERLEWEAPEYPKYKTTTDREIVILRLRRR